MHFVDRFWRPRHQAALALLVLFFTPFEAPFAQCTTQANTVECLDRTVFTTDANLWGPNNERPADATVRILSESWNESGTAGDTAGFGDFGTFGGRVSANTNGSFGLFFGISGMNGGRVQATYDTTQEIQFPVPNNFRPGSEISIIFFGGGPTGSSGLTTNGELNAGKLSLWGELALNASFGASVCAGACISASTPSIGFNSFGNGGFPLPPATSLAEGRARQLIFEVPIGLNQIVSGPVRDIFFALGQGNCTPRRIEITEDSPPGEKAGISGCVGFPGFPMNGGPNSVPFTMFAQRDDTFIDLDLDLDFWASKIRGVPPLGFSETIGDGPSSATFSADALDVDLNNKLTLRQRLTLQGDPRVRLDFPFPIQYTITRNGTLIESGFSDSVELDGLQRLNFPAPAQPLSIATTYLLKNTFHNDSELIYDATLTEKILLAGFRLRSILLGFGVRICVPLAGCWSPGIFSPDISFPLGPLKSFDQQVKTLRDSSLFDNNRPPWTLPGFQEISGTPINIDPAELPVIMLQGPTASVPEGSEVTISTNGSFDADGDSFFYRVFARRTRANSPDRPSSPFLYNDGSQGVAETSFSFTVPDDGEYTVDVRDSDSLVDGRGVSSDRRDVLETFVFEAHNVAPTLTITQPSNDIVLDEGEAFDASISFFDPGQDSLNIDFDWGDGFSTRDFRSIPDSSRTSSRDHGYDDDGTYITEICVTDDEGGQACDDFGITVNNVAPELQVFSEVTRTPDLMTGGLDFDVLVSAEFRDFGRADTHTARLIFNDEMTEDALTVQQFPGSSGRPNPYGSFGRAIGTAQRSFTTTGTRTTTVCVVDDDGAETCDDGPSFDVPAVDVSVTLGMTPTPGRIGDPVELSLTVANAGPDTAPNTTATVMLPNEVGAPQTGAGAGTLERELQPFDLITQDANLAFGDTLDAEGTTLAVVAKTSGFMRTPAVYVFQRTATGWMPHGTRLEASDGVDGDEFGIAVAVSDDESLIAVSAPLSGDSGAIYIFTRQDPGTPADQTDDTWLETDKLSAAGLESGALLGQSLAFDGALLVAGAPGENQSTTGQPDFLAEAGALVVFEQIGGGFTAEIVRDNPRAQFGSFGGQVAVEAGRVAATGRTSGGDGVIRILEDMAGTFTETQTLDGNNFAGVAANFGSRGLAMDGDRLLVLSNQNFHGLTRDGVQFVLDNEVDLSAGFGPNQGIDVLGPVAAVSMNTPNDEAYVQVLRFEDAAWGLAEQLNIADPADRTAFAANSLAVVDGEILAGQDDATRLGKSRMGAVFAMVGCDAGDGVVTCAMGDVPSGDSANLTVIARLGCGVTAGTMISSSATIMADAIDSNATNNSATATINTELRAFNQCGLDATPPQIVPMPAGTLGDNGWYTSDVNLTWQVVDPDGPVTANIGCDPVSITTDTAGTVFTCEATSAGGTASRSITIARDATAPTVSPVIVGTMGSNSWFTSSVDLSFDCSDALSGIASCTPTTTETVDVEGVSAPLLAIATDNAGNETELFQTVSLDFTPPGITVSRTASNDQGWNNSDVTATFTCSDATSDVDTCPADIVLSSEGGDQSVQGTARDLAGLEASAEITSINIDKTPPTVNATTAPDANASGWYSGAVESTFECTDDLSGVLACPDRIVFATEGAAQTASRDVHDLADNVATVDIGPINIDLTPPAITAMISPEPNANGLRALPVTIVFDCTDALSGPDGCPDNEIIVAPGLDQSVVVSSRDLAGNERELVIEGIDAGVPALTLATGNQTLVEGEPLPVRLASVVTPTLTSGIATVDYGDGYSEQRDLDTAPTPAPIDVAYAYADDGDYTVTISVEPLVGETLTASFDVAVSNAAPSFTSLTVGPAPKGFGPVAGQPVDANFVFTDGGAADTHSATIDWGDGTPIQSVAVETSPIGPPSPGAMTGTIVASHSYLEAGDYGGRSCVTDDDGAETCADFTVQVGAAPPIPVATCSAAIGTPVVGASEIVVPITSSVDTTAGQTVDAYDWTEALGTRVIADSAAQDTDVTIPLDGSDSYELGVAVIATVTGSEGGTGYCLARACANIAPDGSTEACPLELEAEYTLDVERVEPLAADLTDAIVLGDTTATYDVLVASASLAQPASVELSIRLIAAFSDVTWECTVDGADRCSASAGTGTVSTTFDLPIGQIARVRLTGEVDGTANFLEFDVRATATTQPPLLMSTDLGRRFIEAFNDGLYKSSFE